MTPGMISRALPPPQPPESEAPCAAALEISVSTSDKRSAGRYR